MTNETKKNLTSVVAHTRNLKKNYKKCEAIFLTKFSFNNQKMKCVKFRFGKKIDRTFVSKISDLFLYVY